MHMVRLPQPLREQLGHDGGAALLEVLAETRKDWTADVLGMTREWFERRLVEETSKVRVEMAHGFAALREDMAKGFADVRQEMAAGNAALRQEIADQRFDILKWAFLFWVGQFFAVASLIAVLIRFLRPS
jgi:hypothetical protein